MRCLQPTVLASMLFATACVTVAQLGPPPDDERETDWWHTDEPWHSDPWDTDPRDSGRWDTDTSEPDEPGLTPLHGTTPSLTRRRVGDQRVYEEMRIEHDGRAFLRRLTFTVDRDGRWSEVVRWTATDLGPIPPELAVPDREGTVVDVVPDPVARDHWTLRLVEPGHADRSCTIRWRAYMRCVSGSGSDEGSVEEDWVIPVE